jgi:peptidoglycan/LPS O-acetylase OafA/YrhL
VRPGRFLIRRGFKIYPAFYALTIPFIMITWGTVSAPGIIGELFFLQNYLGGMWGHTWSLAVEEHFYLLLAGYVWVMVTLRPSQPFRSLPPTFVIVAAFCFINRVIVSDRPSVNWMDLHNPTHLRIDSLMFGVLLSYYWHLGELRSHARRLRVALIVVGISLLAPAFLFPLGLTSWIPTIGFTGLYLGSGSLLLGLLSMELPSTRFVRALAAVGTYSYSIYLWHWVIRFLAITFVVESAGWFVYAMTYLGGALAVGILSAQLIEVPALAIRDRFFPSREARYDRAFKRSGSANVSDRDGSRRPSVAQSARTFL